jgi:hypothetical protein
MPDIYRFQGRPDPAGDHDERVRHYYERVQACDKGPVFQHLGDEGVDLLLEGKSTGLLIDRCESSGSASLTPSLAACINPGPPPVTMSQPSRAISAARFRTAACTQSSLGTPSGPEYGHAIARPRRRPQARQVVDGFPQVQDGLGHDINHFWLVLKAARRQSHSFRVFLGLRATPSGVADL